MLVCVRNVRAHTAERREGRCLASKYSSTGACIYTHKFIWCCVESAVLINKCGSWPCAAAAERAAGAAAVAAALGDESV
jgi:hypothetical protein